VTHKQSQLLQKGDVVWQHTPNGRRLVQFLFYTPQTGLVCLAKDGTFDVHFKVSVFAEDLEELTSLEKELL
jgi:hypothetical protein